YPDFCTRQVAALATIGALVERERSGRGQYIDLALFELAIHLLGTATLDYAANGRRQRRAGNAVMGMWPNGAYPCAADPDRPGERWIALTVRDDREWRGLVAAMGDPPWAAPYATVLARRRDAAALDAHIASWTATQP